MIIFIQTEIMGYSFLNSFLSTYVLVCVYLLTHVGVQNLRQSTTTTAIIIEWDPAVSPSDCGPVFYYIVTVDGSNAMNTFEERAEFSNLINGTIYNISITAVNRAGTGPPSSMNVAGNVEGD